MSALVDAGEAELALLAHGAVFGVVHEEGRVGCCAEGRGVGVRECEADCLAAEPVAWGVV